MIKCGTHYYYLLSEVGCRPPCVTKFPFSNGSKVLLCPRGAPPPYALVQGFICPLGNWFLLATSFWKATALSLFLGLLLVTQNVLYQVGT
jgi:hypothetical protein